MNKNTIKLILCALFLLFILFKNPYKLIFVVGDSMLPTYKHNQMLLAKKTNNYKINDVVVLNVEGDIIIKRIKYVEDEYIYFYFMDNGKLFLDNSYETIHTFMENNKSILLYDMRIPKNCYFVMGDNRNHSDDSRRFGYVHDSEILYKVID